MFIVMRLASVANANMDILNKGTFSGDSTRQGVALFARGSTPSVSFVETGMVGSAGFANVNDPTLSWNAAGITRAGASVFSPQQWLFAQEYGAVPASLGCHGRKLNGFDAGAYPQGNWWDAPLSWGNAQPLLSSGWSNGAPGADNDGTWRAGYEKIDSGTCPNAPTCNGTCLYQWTDTGNGANLRLGGGSAFNNGQNLMKGEIYEVIMWSNPSAVTTSQDVKNVEAYLADKYFLNCGAAYGPAPADVSMYNYTSEMCAGGGADATCHAYCSANYVRVAGAYNNLACIAGKWQGFQLGAYQTFGRQSCLPSCPALLAPANLDTSGNGCWATRFNEALGPDPLRPGWELRSFTSWPHFPDAFLAQKFFTASDAASGGYAIADSTFRRLDDPAFNGLGRDAQITLFVSSSATYTPTSTLTQDSTYAVRVRVLSGRAGLATRIGEDPSNQNIGWYQVLVAPEIGNGTTGVGATVTVARYVNRLYSVQIAGVTRPLGAGPFLGEWFSLRAVLSQTSTNLQTISINGVAVISGLADPYGMMNNPGSGFGLQIDGLAHFANFSYTTACDGGGGGLLQGNAWHGTSVQHTCQPGFALASGSASRSCNWGAWTGSPAVCQLAAPVFNSSSTSLGVVENAGVGTLVGYVSARTVATTVTYSISGGNAGGVFAVDACSGAITVARAGAMDFFVQSAYALTLQALANNDPTAAATLSVTVTLSVVNTAPRCSATTVLAVPEIGPAGTPATPALYLASDRESDPVTFSILSGNDAGTFAFNRSLSNPFAAALTLSVPSTGISPLDFEMRPTLPLILLLRDGRNPLLQTQCAVSVSVTNVNDPPVIAPAQVLTISEVAAASASPAAPAPTTPAAVAFFEQDVGDTQIFQVMAVYGGVMTDGSGPLLASAPIQVNSATGALMLASPVVVTDASQELVVQGSWLARAAYTVVLRLQDAAGAASVANVTVVVTVSNSASSSALVTGVTLPPVCMTAGGDALSITGNGLGALTGSTLVVSYGAYTATACAVNPGGGTVNPFVACKTAPGVGLGMAIVLRTNGIRVRSQGTFLLSYAPPLVSTVSAYDTTLTGVNTTGLPNPSAASTAGGELFFLMGSNLGATGLCGAETSLKYGPPGAETKYVAAPVTCKPYYISFRTIPGVGGGLAFALSVGGQALISPPSSGISYGRPSLVSVGVPAFVSYTAKTLPTLSGVDVVFSGTNFGPQQDVDASLVVPAVTYGGAAAGTYTMTSCRKPSGLAAHTTLTCTSVPGIGGAMPVQISVAGTASVVSASAQLALGYVPPTISSISGGGATAASTIGGDAIIVSGAGFGPAADNGVVPVTDALSPRFGRGGGGLSYGVGAGALQATSCAVVSDSLIQCLAAPGTGKNRPWALTVAGQTANFTATLQSYAAPTVFSFSGTPATAGATGGGEAVTITGENFGPNAALVTARYVWAASGSQPKGALSNATYVATACAMTTPHFVLTCQTAPGAGAGLKWTLVVDGISSSTPSTSYAPPAITFVGSASSTTITNAVASTVIHVFGTNLGPGVASVDSITCEHASPHFQLHCAFPHLTHPAIPYHLCDPPQPSQTARTQPAARALPSSRRTRTCPSLLALALARGP